MDYAQVIKTYGAEETTHNRRYSAPDFVSAEKVYITGRPDMDLGSTSYVERLNTTTRLHLRRLTRLTLAFSKKREAFDAAAGLHFASYNFVKRHSTIRRTPGMCGLNLLECKEFGGGCSMTSELGTTIQLIDFKGVGFGCTLSRARIVRPIGLWHSLLLSCLDCGITWDHYRETMEFLAKLLRRLQRFPALTPLPVNPVYCEI